MWALVEPSGRVAQIADEPFSVHPSLRWVEVQASETVATEDRWDGQRFMQRRPSPDLAAMSLAEAKAVARGLVNAERLRREGPRIDASVGEATTPVDTRDERDFRNLLGLTLDAVVAVAITQDEAAVYTFRDAENVDHRLSPAEVLLLAEGVSGAINANSIGWSWVVKDAIDAAEDVSEVQAILAAEGLAWPRRSRPAG